VEYVSDKVALEHGFPRKPISVSTTNSHSTRSFTSLIHHPAVMPAIYVKKYL
jgi:hypothetical protein